MVRIFILYSKHHLAKYDLKNSYVSMTVSMIRMIIISTDLKATTVCLIEHCDSWYLHKSQNAESESQLQQSPAM
jgi:hypothetical protein